VGQTLDRDEFLGMLVDQQYERNDFDLSPGRFRVRGDSVDLVPAYQKNILRFEFFSDQLESISEIRPIKGELARRHAYIQILPARHFVTPQETIEAVIPQIRADLKSRLKELSGIEAHRLEQRTLYDLEMLQETGFCKGIENYSRYFDGRKVGDRPYCLLDYLPVDALIVIDESHQTLPQVKAMYRGDRSRKTNLVEYGFRLPSAYDNRPLTFAEFQDLAASYRIIYLSATPGEYESARSSQRVEQIIRPTGLVDPEVEVRPTEGQMQNLLGEIRDRVKRGMRTLVTTLTKRFSEELSEFFADQGIKTRYLHSEIDTLDRTELIRQLRLGEFDVLVGINLLREGLDIPEVGLVAILDADKEGFLRDTRSLIQTIGRAARNSESRVLLYADKVTESMRLAMEETERRRTLQTEYNRVHGITPRTIIKPIELKEALPIHKTARDLGSVEEAMATLQVEMEKAAERLDFESAILLREEIKRISNFAGEEAKKKKR
jgi:excinuclease ABC subunit B